MTIMIDELNYVRSTVRQVPDFPKPGILFLDITTATKDAKAMNLMIDFLYEKFKDENLKNFFSDEERKIIKEAIEDHRASAKDEPRSIYGRIVSSADRNNTVEACLRRTYTYGKKIDPNATDEELFLRAYDVLTKKFGEDGYAKFYFRDTVYEAFLKELRELKNI